MISFFRKLLPFTLTALIVSNASYSNPASSNNQLEGRPSNIPAEYIAAPGGYVHPTCIATLNDKEKVNSDGKVIRNDATERVIPDCNREKYTKYGKEISSSETSKDAFIIDGWEAYITHPLKYNNGIQKIVGQWTVPGLPLESGHQTLFLFNSIRTQEGIIIQPVLGFNQSGAPGPQWSISSWAVGSGLCTNGYCKSGNTTVEPGDVITGTFTRVIPSGVDPQSVKKWNISISATRNGTQIGSQSLDIVLPSSHYYSYEEGVYETHGAKSCGQIDMTRDLVSLRMTFITEHVAWKYGSPSMEPAKVEIHNEECSVRATLLSPSRSEIYYGNPPN